ncbi:MAG: NHL repeat-containing protein [Anaerolineae bacterium]|nr:NHL repeat-containing protein [Anaerolineae bacterium]
MNHESASQRISESADNKLANRKSANPPLRPTPFSLLYPKSKIAPILLALLILVACAPKPLMRPTGVAVAPDGSVYVMDRGNYRVVHFGADGSVLGTFGAFGTGPENIHTGWDAALDSSGNILICNFVLSAEDDVIHDGVRVFTPKGQFVREVGGKDYFPGAGDPVHSPYGLDVDAQDRVYVVDFNSNTLRIFDPQGHPLGIFFGEIGDRPAQFNGINDVAVDDTRGLIYLSDNVNCRIQQFSLTFNATGTPALEYLRSFGEYGEGSGQLAYPQGLTLNDTSGTLYVADNANRRIQAFDPEGNLVAGFAPPDTPIWQVLQLATGPDGAIYATDGYNNAIWVFEADGAYRSKIEVAP